MPTNAVILANAPIACVLAGNDIQKGSLFGQRVDSPAVVSQFPFASRQKILRCVIVLSEPVDVSVNVICSGAAMLSVDAKFGVKGILLKVYQIYNYFVRKYLKN